MSKWVYLFEEGNADMRNLLGGKGANLAEMTNLGLPIPQGFTVTTEACTDYYNNGRQISEEIQSQIFAALADLEEKEKSCFCDDTGWHNECSMELAEKFLKNFKDLIKKAGDLI